MSEQHHERLNWGQAWTLYRRELRGALRERNIVLNSVLLPLFLYPFILWALLTGLLFVQGQTQGMLSRIAVNEWPQGHPGLRQAFQRHPQISLHPPGENPDLNRELLSGKLDALIQFVPKDGPPGTTPNFEARVLFNESNERSVAARRRATDLVGEYRQQWLKREAKARGVPEAAWTPFEINNQNVASGKQMGAFLQGMILPILFVVMMAVGCFYPAVDATAGERERQTWETLMCSAISRRSVVAGKYLYVVTMGGLAGLLNLAAMILTIRPLFGPLLAQAGETLHFTLRPAAIPALLLGVVLLAAFVGGAMMLFAAFARTFKEGQAMITPFYLCIMLPLMFLQVPGLKFTLPLAFVPVVNVTLMARAALSGTLEWLPALATVVVSLVLIVGVIRLAAFILQFEDVVMGSYNGSLFRLLRERFRRPSPTASRS